MRGRFLLIVAGLQSSANKGMCQRLLHVESTQLARACRTLSGAIDSLRLRLASRDLAAVSDIPSILSGMSGMHCQWPHLQGLDGFCWHIPIILRIPSRSMEGSISRNRLLLFAFLRHDLFNRMRSGDALPTSHVTASSTAGCRASMTPPRQGIEISAWSEPLGGAPKGWSRWTYGAANGVQVVQTRGGRDLVSELDRLPNTRKGPRNSEGRFITGYSLYFVSNPSFCR